MFTTKQILLLGRLPTRFDITQKQFLLTSKYIYSSPHCDNIFTVRGVLSSNFASLGNFRCPLADNRCINSSIPALVHLLLTAP